MKVNMSLRTVCQKCLLNSSFRQFLVLPRTGFKSQYSIDQIYPNSNVDILRQNRYETTEPGFTGYIPLDKLEIKNVRGTGPGGQHVNTTSNKVEIRFHVDSADWIPDDLKEKFSQQEKNRINKAGFFITTSHRTRKQLLNRVDCLDKIRTAVYTAMIERKPPTEKHLQNVEKRIEKAQRERLLEKRNHSMKKRQRQNQGFDD